jgi:hypothetical protein
MLSFPNFLSSRSCWWIVDVQSQLCTQMGIVSQLRQQHQQNNTKTEKRKENSVVVGESGNPSVALTSGTWPIRAIGLKLVIQFF